MLKYIAVITMLLDHVNNILYDNQYFILTYLGRLAFPLFIYITVNSYINYTKDKLNYIFRILIFGLISTPIYYYAFEVALPLNIFFSIALGLMVLIMIENKLILFSWIPFALALYVDYSIYSTLAFLAFYVFLKDKNIYTGVSLFIALFLLNPPYLNGYLILFFALLFFDMYIKLDFKSALNKYVFYFFYPVHILILGLIK